MAGLVQLIHVLWRTERPQAATRGAKTPAFVSPCSGPPPMPGRSLRQRGVDGREKPGHDDSGSEAQSLQT